LLPLLNYFRSIWFVDLFEDYTRLKQRYSAENEITCEVTGPVRILGMEDSNPRNIESYKDNKQHAYHGKLLIYFQSLDKSGKAVIKLSSPGLQGATVEIDVVK